MPFKNTIVHWAIQIEGEYGFPVALICFAFAAGYYFLMSNSSFRLQISIAAAFAGSAVLICKLFKLGSMLARI